MNDSAVYLPNIIKAVDYIDCHLKRKLSLQEIAWHAWYSEFHFHRIFTGTTGHTLKDYIRKRRLSEAAKDLVISDKSIGDLSREYGFSNQESFTRAFQKLFVINPSLYRFGGVMTSIVEKMEIGNVVHPYAGKEIGKPILQSHPTRYFIGMKFTGTNNNHDIFNLTYLFLHRKNEIKNQINGEQYYGLAKYHIGNSGEQLFDFYATMPVSSLRDIPQGMIGIEIPPTDYAVITYKGNSEYLYSSEGAESVYSIIYETLLPHYGLQVKEDSFSLQYENSYRAVESDFTKILVPVNV